MAKSLRFSTKRIHPSFFSKKKIPSLLKFTFLKKPLRPKRLSPRRYTTWVNDFKRFWGILRPHRLPFKSFRLYKPFQKLTPLPYKSYGNFFRSESRVFTFWYKFHLRKYCLNLDVGAKQRKLVSENAVWLRDSRRDIPPSFGFWHSLRLQDSFKKIVSKNIWSLNSNLINPFFLATFRTRRFRWFEEKLPAIRLYAWSHYTRVSTLSLDVSLTQSLFDKKALFRRLKQAPPSLLWLASPIQTNSVLISSYLDNTQLIFPEWFFQFKRRLSGAKKLWNQFFSTLWCRAKTPVVFLQQSFLCFRSNLSAYFINRFLARFFAASSTVFFISLKNWKTSLRQSHWSVRTFPAITHQYNRWSRTPSYSFFSTGDWFKRHFRRNFFRNYWTLSLVPVLSSAPQRLNFFLSLFLKQYVFRQNEFFFYHLCVLWAYILSEIELAVWDIGYHFALTPIKPPATYHAFRLLRKHSRLNKHVIARTKAMGAFKSKKKHVFPNKKNWR